MPNYRSFCTMKDIICHFRKWFIEIIIIPVISKHKFFERNTCDTRFPKETINIFLISTFKINTLFLHYFNGFSFMVVVNFVKPEQFFAAINFK